MLAANAVLTHDDELLARAVAAAPAAAPQDTTVEAFVLFVEGMLRSLVAEDRPRALRSATDATARLRGAPVAPPAQFRAMWSLLVALDGDDAAPAAIDEVQRSGVGVNRLNLGYLSYARAVLIGRRDGDAAAALVAAGDLDLVHGPFWHQLGRRLVSEAAKTDGWGDPVTWADEAREWFRGRGFDALADACGAIAGTGHPSPVPWAHLGVTRREADVLALVVEGCPNKEIAARLYLSPRTVEKHLQSLMRKTSSRSRTQLALLAASHGRDGEVGDST
jgi:DNA-binding CsgD family transcriptional regulator